jgi:hypothetical protein
VVINDILKHFIKVGHRRNPLRREGMTPLSGRNREELILAESANTIS